MKKSQLFLVVTILLFLQGCSAVKDFEVIKYNKFEVVHFNPQPATTNSYIIYEIKSGTAAIIDPGWKTDSLISFIKKHNLHLAYIFITHGHIDHIFGLSQIKKQNPEVKICIHKTEFENISAYQNWINNPQQNNTDKQKNETVATAYRNFEPASINKPDIFVEDNQSFKLGSMEIKTIHTPGHAAGEICYYTGNILFSGDVLLYRTVGGYSSPEGSKEDLKRSVRLLYKVFPDATVIYPGHGEFTDMGSEKLLNKKITVNKEAL
jgi:glyoxylase-like metal-dependent hydrolase (beta-lactamase superfamily II)